MQLFSDHYRIQFQEICKFNVRIQIIYLIVYTFNIFLQLQQQIQLHNMFRLAFSPSCFLHAAGKTIPGR